MVWNQQAVIVELKRRFKAGEKVSHSDVVRENPPLVAAACRHFGNYGAAINAAGINYDKVRRTQRWTAENVVAVIQKAHRAKLPLNCDAVFKRGGEMPSLLHAANVLFGSWDGALVAAGLNPAEIRLKRKWDAASLVAELQNRHRRGEPLNAFAVLKQDCGLHRTAVRYFDTWDAALVAAGMNPADIRLSRQAKNWTLAEILQSLRQLSRDGMPITREWLLRDHRDLAQAITWRFGSFATACAAAGVQFRRKPSRRPPKATTR